MGNTTVNTIINAEKTDDDVAVNTTIDVKECTPCPVKGKQSDMCREELWKIWEQLNKNRALEISTLWQRSVFLSAFIVLLLTGSGIFYYNFILKKPLAELAIKHGLSGMLLGCLLMIGGILWLAMAKGSKYWSRVYEIKISLLEEELQIKDQYRYLTEKYKDGTTKPADKKDDLLAETSWINPLKADSESPSRVNCFIGCLIFLIGIFMLFIPASIQFKNCNVWQYCWKAHFVIFTLAVIIMMVFCGIVYWILHHTPEKR